MTSKTCPKCFKKNKTKNKFCEKCGAKLDLKEYIEEKKIKKGIKDSFKSFLNLKNKTDDINNEIEKFILTAFSFNHFEEEYDNVQKEYISPKKAKEFKNKYEPFISKFKNISYHAIIKKDNDLNTTFSTITQYIRKLNNFNKTVDDINSKFVNERISEINEFNNILNEIKTTKNLDSTIKSEFKDTYSFFKINKTSIQKQKVKTFLNEYENLESTFTQIKAEKLEEEKYITNLKSIKEFNKKLNQIKQSETLITKNQLETTYKNTYEFFKTSNGKPQDKININKFIANYNSLNQIIDKHNDKIKEFEKNLSKIEDFNLELDQLKESSIEITENKLELEYKELYEFFKRNNVAKDNDKVNAFLSEYNNLNQTIKQINKIIETKKIEKQKYKENFDKINEFNNKLKELKTTKEEITENILEIDYKQLYDFFKNISISPDTSDKIQIDTFLTKYENLDKIINEINTKINFEKNLSKIKEFNKDLNQLKESTVKITENKLESKYKQMYGFFKNINIPLKNDKTEIITFLKDYENLDNTIAEINEKIKIKEFKKHLPKIDEFNLELDKLKSDKISQSSISNTDKLIDEFKKIYNFFSKKQPPLPVNVKRKINNYLIDYDNLSLLKKDFKNYLAIENKINELNKFIPEIKYFNDCLNGSSYVDYPKRVQLANYNTQFTSVSTLNNELKTMNSKFTQIKKPAFNLDSQLSKFLKTYPNLTNVIEKNNRKYIKNELKENKKFFDNIGGKSLDEKQRLACVCDEQNIQIIAGAGAGKTLTMVAKAKYLIEKKGIKPEDIIYVSYTNASVDDLAKRMPEGTKGYTFHRLGGSILRDNQKPSRPYEYLLSNFIKHYFKRYIRSTFKYVLQFYAFYPYNHITPDEETSIGEILDMEEGKDFRTLRELYGKDNEKITMDNQVVKSLEELIIANYFFVHQIEYEYEPVYHVFSQKYSNQKEFVSNILYDYYTDEVIHNETLEIIMSILYRMQYDSLNYRPDFYLPEYDIYLEHFGIDKDGNANFIKDDVQRRKYVEGISWKRNMHKKYGTRLIETYSYYMAENKLLSKLEEKLKKENVTIHPIDYDYLLKKLTDRNEVNSFRMIMHLLKEFIELFKGNHYSTDKFEEFRKENSDSEKSEFNKKRNELFLNIVEDVYINYEKHKENVVPKNSPVKYDNIDFNDMINNATDLIKSSDVILKSDCKYIIVDEYQDTSYTRYDLLKSLQDYTGAKVCVVGDDWQSIYRFSGCDVSLFTHFEDYFPHHRKIIIEKTYRNSQKLIETAGKFIMKNDDQHKKNLKSSKSLKNPIKIAYYNNKKEEEQIFEYLINKACEKSDNILILGRNNHDINKFLGLNKNGEIIPNKHTPFRRVDKDSTRIIYNKNKKLNINYRTIHSSKGLEEDNVVLINLTKNIAGFPNKMENDEVLNFVINKHDSYPFAEERRLFYVALTRTKNNIYLLAPEIKKSIFVEEIEDGCEVISKEEILGYDKQLYSKEKLLNKAKSTYILTNLNCPYCETGNVKLVIYKDKKDYDKIKQFITCTHDRCFWGIHPYYSTLDLLDYIKICPDCGGILEVENGRYGAYYKCSERKCDKSERITGEELEITTKILNKHDKQKPHTTTKTQLKCPQCEKGDVVLIATKHRNHFECSKNSCDWNGGTTILKSHELSEIEYCPSCDGLIVDKLNKRGSVFRGCTKWPNCRESEFKLNETVETDIPCPHCLTGNIKVDIYDNRKELKCTNKKCVWEGCDYHLEISQLKVKKCPNCGGTLIPKKGKYGIFMGCTNFKTLKCNGRAKIPTNVECPHCHHRSIEIELNDKGTKRIICSNDYCNWNGCNYKLNINKLKLKKCPECGGTLIPRSGRNGIFMGCTNYPNCTYSEKY